MPGQYWTARRRMGTMSSTTLDLEISLERNWPIEESEHRRWRSWGIGDSGVGVSAIAELECRR
eukprot:3114723-Rhodomonas_salina.3